MIFMFQNGRVITGGLGTAVTLSETLILNSWPVGSSWCPPRRTDLHKQSGCMATSQPREQPSWEPCPPCPPDPVLSWAGNPPTPAGAKELQAIYGVAWPAFVRYG